jgi:hypothetical protein
MVQTFRREFLPLSSVLKMLCSLADIYQRFELSFYYLHLQGRTVEDEDSISKADIGAYAPTVRRLLQ